MNAPETVDVAGLVEDGLLDLDEVFRRVRFRRLDGIATYSACACAQDEPPILAQVVLESATAYGITAYRWIDADSAYVHERGPVTLDRDEAIADGREWAESHDEEPDTDELVQQIVDTGYFGPHATVADIRAVCEEATRHSQGYLMLAAGSPPPVPHTWTTNGYLQHDHVVLGATYPRVSHAADALLRAVKARLAYLADLDDEESA